MLVKDKPGPFKAFWAKIKADKTSYKIYLVYNSLEII